MENVVQPCDFILRIHTQTDSRIAPVSTATDPHEIKKGRPELPKWLQYDFMFLDDLTTAV